MLTGPIHLQNITLQNAKVVVRTATISGGAAIGVVEVYPNAESAMVGHVFTVSAPTTGGSAEAAVESYLLTLPPYSAMTPSS